jgi:putative transcriptional regulator
MSAPGLLSRGTAMLAVCSVLSAFSAATIAGAQQSFPNPLRRGALEELTAGKLLVAARNLPDPNFAETIVLLADANEKGAMGLVVNRRTDVPLARLAPGLEEPGARPRMVFLGGPVAVPGVVALLRTKDAPADARRVFRDIYLVNTRASLQEALSTGAGNDRFRVYVGYAGWGAGQLEAEAAKGAWHVFEGDAAIVFDADPDSAWERQIRRAEALQAERRPGEAGSPMSSARAR